MASFNHQLDRNGSSDTSDQVLCDAPSGISVLIVGAGVAGLMAALECHRKGHSVTLWERTSSASAGGDMFTIGLSGRRVIRKYATMQRELDQISLHNQYMGFRQHSGQTVSEPKQVANMFGAAGPQNVPMAIQLRPLYHEMLYHQIDRFGIKVAFGKRVVEYFEDAERGVAGVVTDQGERAEADVVIAADGLNSRSQELILGGLHKGVPTGRSIYRVAYPLDIALADPLVKENFDLREGKFPFMQNFLGPDTHMMALTYVDKAGENGQIIWGLTYKEGENQDTKESWHDTVTNERVLQTLDETPGWCEAIKALVKRTPPEHIVHWPLLWRDPQPLWHTSTGRIIQIGDAAHSFLPTSGNGATQAIEDSVTIAECLKQGGKGNIPLAVKTHNLLRFDRVSCAQRIGFENAQRWHKNDFSKGPPNPEALKPMVPKWVFTHDPEQYAIDNYAKAAASLEGGESFSNTNIPPGHVPKAWSMAEVRKLEAEGKKIELTGDWS